MRRAVRYLLATLAIALPAGIAIIALPTRNVPTSPGRMMLESHAMWVGPFSLPCWSPVTYAGKAYIWRRSSSSPCVEMPADGSWLLWDVDGPDGMEAAPHLGDRRAYIAVRTAIIDRQFVSNVLFAYDLDRPLAYRRSRTARDPIWHSIAPQGIVAGMNDDRGVLFVTAIRSPLGGAMTALQGTTGKVVWQRHILPPVGDPAIGNLGNLQRAVFIIERRFDGTALLVSLDTASGRVLRQAALALRPVASPIVAGNLVLVGGVSDEERPTVIAVNVDTGRTIWQFRANSKAAHALLSWSVNARNPSFWNENPPTQLTDILFRPSPGHDVFRQQPGGLAVMADASRPGGGLAIFACGEGLYAMGLSDGHPRWEHEPEIDPNALAALQTELRQMAAGKTSEDRSELPPYPWVTAPAICGSQVLFGMPDGLHAVAASDGQPLWHMASSDVGAVDVPPRIEDGVAYVSSQGYIGAQNISGRSNAITCAIRLDLPLAPASLSSPGSRLQRWPWLGLMVAIALPIIIVVGRRAAPNSDRRLPSVAVALLPAAALAAFVIWPNHPPSAFNPKYYRPIYAGGIPWLLLVTEAALVYAATVLAAWHRRKLTFAAALSLAAAAAITALWVRGTNSADALHVYSCGLLPDRIAERDWEFVSASGGFRLGWKDREVSVPDGLLTWRQRIQWGRAGDEPSYPIAEPLKTEDKGSVHTWHGFEAQSRMSHEFDRLAVAHEASMTFPDWCPLAALGLFPAVWLGRSVLRSRYRRRRRRGHCTACGYNLKGNTSGVCPECGARTPQVSTLDAVMAGEPHG